MSDIRHQMPILARHEGVWDGTYRYYDAEGEKTDEHTSRLICRFTDEGIHPYHQTNYYRWPDGQTEERDFPAFLKNGRIEFDSDLIEGWAGEIELDDFKRTIMLNWVRKGDPDLYLYEMIQISDCGLYRHRIWHWYREGRLLQRTAIDEQKVSDRWQDIEGESYAGDPIE